MNVAACRASLLGSFSSLMSFSAACWIARRNLARCCISSSAVPAWYAVSSPMNFTSSRRRPAARRNDPPARRPPRQPSRPVDRRTTNRLPSEQAERVSWRDLPQTFVGFRSAKGDKDDRMGRNVSESPVACERSPDWIPGYLRPKRWQNSTYHANSDRPVGRFRHPEGIELPESAAVPCCLSSDTGLLPRSICKKTDSFIFRTPLKS